MNNFFKIFFTVIIVLSIVGIAAFHIVGSKMNVMSDTKLANLEALAKDENGGIILKQCFESVIEDSSTGWYYFSCDLRDAYNGIFFPCVNPAICGKPANINKVSYCYLPAN